jgi:DNA-binding transcriptional ArsR family regulator
MDEWENAKMLAELFKLLSVDARVRILQLLRRRAFCVTELTSQLGISIAATSVHLRLLRGAGIVHSIKRGLFVYYQLNKKKTTELGKSLGELFKPKSR